MTENPFYFANGDYQLFGIHHHPSQKDNKKGFVFCYPFEEEKLWVQRVFVNLARELCQRGYHILRFDFMGEGDSEGNFEDSNIDSRLADISCAIRRLQMNVPHLTEINLFGMRFGATLASVSAEHEPAIKKLIMWDPIISGLDYLNEELRKNLTTQVAVYRKIVANRESLVGQLRRDNTVNIDGYELSRSLYEQAAEIDLLDGNKKFTGKCLTIQISRNKDEFKPQLMHLQKLYKNMELKICSEYSFWKEIKFYYAKADNLFNETMKWLEDNGE